ncbi:MAG TPA: AAA family ATPase [Burkholderiales bacterium]|nr:AAA family ATPase [Burkholderiales bacterium]
MALYLEHFGLSEPPFRITPHTDFFFEGADRGATLEALIYAVLHDEGIVKVSGEVGSGKTMLSRVLMERLPEYVDTIYLATPSLAAHEILHAIADDLEVAISRERRTVALRELQEHLIELYARGRRVVILIDEAHVMPEDTLEQVRLLSNLESNRHKLLQIVLFGQPELDTTLAKTSLRQLRDRITHAFRMRPLSLPEVAKYLSFRMRAAGYRGPEVFSGRAIRSIERASGGLTRRINILADKALLAAFTENTHAVTAPHVRAAVRDSEFASAPARLKPVAYAGVALVAGIVLGAGLQWIFQDSSAEEPTSATPAVQVTALEKPAEPPPAPPEASLAEASLAMPPTLLGDGQARRFEGYSSGGQRLLAERIAATRLALERVPGERYAIELFVTSNTEPARMERFLLRARDMVPLEDLLVIPMGNGGGGYRLCVALGEFPSRTEAMEAAKRLPPKYQDAFEAIPRSFADLRDKL